MLTTEKYSNFRLITEAEVVDLVYDGNLVTGVKATTSTGHLEVHALLTVGADGRHSKVRERAELQVDVLGAPIDVLWFRVSRRRDDPGQALGRFSQGKVMVMLNRDVYWQCGFVISKGSFESLKQRGLDSFHQDIFTVAPFLKDRAHELNNWDEIKLLTVAVDRLLRWHRPGLLCIGDSAHAMSPVGGVGINLAIQDAVATANLLSEKLRAGQVTTADLGLVQQRRLFPTRVTQRVQVFIQDQVLRPALTDEPQNSAPWFLKLFRWFPILQRIPAYLVGVGIRPEHIQR